MYAYLFLLFPHPTAFKHRFAPARQPGLTTMPCKKSLLSGWTDGFFAF
jgi:hypothetical protein